jgi:hypothetical protein
MAGFFIHEPKSNSFCSTAELPEWKSPCSQSVSLELAFQAAARPNGFGGKQWKEATLFRRAGQAARRN